MRAKLESPSSLFFFFFFLLPSVATASSDLADGINGALSFISNLLGSSAGGGDDDVDVEDLVDEDMFASTFEMARLLREEMSFSKNLFKYKRALEIQLSQVSGVLASVYPDGPVDVPDPESHVANPMNAFSLVRRLGNDLRFETVKKGVEVLGDISSRLVNATALFPSKANYVDATSGMLLLQESYALNVTSLAQGKLQVGDKTFESKGRPSWNEVLALGQASCRKGFYDSCIAWYRTALDGHPELERRTGAEVADVKKRLSEARQTREYMRDVDGHPAVQARKNRVPLFRSVSYPQRLQKNFQDLCSEEAKGEGRRRPTESDAPLRCYGLHHGKAFLRLGPLKLEELSELPYVATVHDFLHPGEMSHLKGYATGRMHRSRTGNDIFADSQQTSSSRTSKQAWLEERAFNFHRSLFKNYTLKKTKRSDPPPIPHEPLKYLEVKDKVGYDVAVRIQDATDLSLLAPFSSEDYQIANYGLGGQYTTHHDSSGYYEDNMLGRWGEMDDHTVAVGDRFVTVMAYLSDVDYGGKTAFPVLGVAAEPEAGAIVLWFNLLSDGHRDLWTYHGGCPVLVGSKWITNKWVYYNDQFRSYPCDLKAGKRHRTMKRWREATLGDGDNNSALLLLC